MDIKLIRNEDCHVWEKAEKELKKALRASGASEEYEVVVVKDKKKAEKLHFFGSPQIIVNGEDIDPNAKKASEFRVEGCRLYMWKGKMHEYPPREMILEAIKKHG